MALLGLFLSLLLSRAELLSEMENLSSFLLSRYLIALRMVTLEDVLVALSNRLLSMLSRTD